MAVVCLGSVRSCGVTTLALALAATWPAKRPVLLVEVDPAGGTLAAASGWATEPSLVSLAAAARRGGAPELVWEHCQQLAGGAAVVAGPPSGEQARSALGLLAGFLPRLGELDADVLMDCGRLDPGPAAFELLEWTGNLVLGVRPRLADLQALAIWLEAHPSGQQRRAVVVMGSGPYPDDEIADALGVDVLGRLPEDPAAAGLLVTVAASARELRLAPLVRAARSLADRLVHDVVPTAPPESSPALGAAGSPGPLRTRVWRPWRDLRIPVTNGSTHEEPAR